ncbi:adenylate/guanylate cyclase domain-containing protein [Christiangramia echinicola]|uniref:Adenylate cyclase n=1 Tax=Christiangramia echinicola TaxID=279359 RepID=A0A1H1RFV1_9FLAO|nr:adenylate/guanylate cyclase domain-containing protein [Christiangramia echinicola]SDS34416.1 adenylate cyclase [Christiangramia echinicola]
MEIASLPFEELKKEKARLEALHSQNILDTDAEEEFDRIVKVASFICGTPISLISLVDTDRQWFKSKIGLDVQETPRNVSFCSHAIQQKGIMEIQDASKDIRFKDNPLVTGDPNIRFYAGTPLITQNGLKLGTLCVIDKVPKTLTQEQKDCLESLSMQIMDQIELKHQRKQLQQLNSSLLIELKQKIELQNKVLHLFVKFVPEAIVAKHLHAKEDDFDDAEAKNLTVLFCDIRGYTAMVDKLKPQHAVAILKAYYSVLSDVIHTYSGMVNQYVGDEIFATFGDPFSIPGYEKDAVFCALEMLNKLKQINEHCKEFISTPIKIGIGIHSGEVITGTLGSKNKIEYSVTGDSVNTGKRIETLTQNHPNTILISRPIYEKVKNFVEVKPWPSVLVKGKSKRLEVFEVLRKKNNL